MERGKKRREKEIITHTAHTHTERERERENEEIVHRKKVKTRELRQD